VARGADIFNPPILDLASVRTRGDLADLINNISDPVAVKQEITGPEAEGMDLDGSTDVEITAVFGGGDQSDDYDHAGDEDESLLEEQEEEAEHVVSCEEEEDDGDEEEEAYEAADGTQVATDTAGEPDSGKETGGNGGEATGGNGGEAAASAEVPGKEDIPTEMNDEKNAPGEREGQEGEGVEDESVAPEEIDPINRNLRPDHRFFAVRAMLAGSMEPRLLNRKLKKPAPEPGFLVEGDERWYRNWNLSCTAKKLNTSASFTPLGRCHTCLSGEHNAWAGRQGQPVIIAASD
jgi:hypothetical protein